MWQYIKWYYSNLGFESRIWFVTYKTRRYFVIKDLPRLDGSGSVHQYTVSLNSSSSFFETNQNPPRNRMFARDIGPIETGMIKRSNLMINEWLTNLNLFLLGRQVMHAWLLARRTSNPRRLYDRTEPWIDWKERAYTTRLYSIKKAKIRPGYPLIGSGDNMHWEVCPWQRCAFWSVGLCLPKHHIEFDGS